jgi:hypothetical protein
MFLQQENDALKRTQKNIILVRPSIKTISMFSLDKIDDAIALGYKEAKKMLS